MKKEDHLVKQEPLPEGGLLQSQQWLDVIRAEGKKVFRFDGINGVEERLPIVGVYVYFPRAYDLLNFDVKSIKNSHYAWARIDVKDQMMLEKIQSFDMRVVPAPHDMQPRHNLIMDISGDEESLLSQMKSKGRYNIRLAKKKNVKIFASKEKKYLDAFFTLVEETAHRKNVHFHNKEHYEKIIRTLPDDMVDLYIAMYGDDIIAVNLISFYGGTATYLHGATSNRHRNVMAPYLLQWHSIIDAKKKGCHWYDLGGVFPGAQDPGKQGITRFKKSFAPKQEPFSTLGSYDIVFSPTRYNAYRLLQWIRSGVHF